MMNRAKLVDKNISSLTDSSIKLRKTLLDLQCEVSIVDSYSQSGAEEKWKDIRSDYDALLHALNETVKLCADTIGDYVVLLPEINKPDMFEDARIELRALVERLKEDDSKRDLSTNFKQLGDTIAQFVNEIDTSIKQKDQDADFKLKEIVEKISGALAEVERLRRMQQENNVNGNGCYSNLYPANESSQELLAAEESLKIARQEKKQADEEMHAHDWPRLQASLGEAKNRLGKMALQHLEIDGICKILTAEVEGHLKVFDEFALENTPATQLAVTKYNRKALDDEPKFVSIQNSLEKFAFAFK